MSLAGQPTTHSETILSSAKRRLITLDSIYRSPAWMQKAQLGLKLFPPEVDDTLPAAAFMRCPDVKATSVNTHSASYSELVSSFA